MVAQFCVTIDEPMMIRAIKRKMTTFIMYIYLHDKNFSRSTDYFAEKEVDSSDSEDDFNIYNAAHRKHRIYKYCNKYQTFTLNWLIKMIIEEHPDCFTEVASNVCEWLMQSSENFIQALIENRLD
jgi:hypothetical protein